MSHRGGADLPLKVGIAGSTGSIGRQTVEVIEAEGPGRYRVAALSVARSVVEVCQQAERWRPEVVVVADPHARSEVARQLSSYRDIEVTADPQALIDAADVVINGVVGFAGLPFTMGALAAGKRLGLANKESLIAAGPVVQPLRSVDGAELVPVDSEHCALHQCLRSSARHDNGEVRRLVLTASGGPFRGRTLDELSSVTVEDALAHPTWAMGPKITVDSSTLVNKGLEVIEAHELFGVDYDQIDVVVHPESVVHSMVEFVDGSTIAQLSMPDMRLPIGYALGYPQRIGTPFGSIDWTTLGALHFEPPDRSTFRGLDLAFEAGRMGGIAPAWLSAANEEAVEAFLAGALSWVQIADIIDATMQECDTRQPSSIDDVIEADGAARRCARQIISKGESS